MRRRPNSLTQLERSILEAALDLRLHGAEEFYGFLVAKRVGENREARLLTAHGTLYKALDRMEKAGLLVSRWEDPEVASSVSRPRRRLYKVTVAGEKALIDFGSVPQAAFQPRRAPA